MKKWLCMLMIGLFFASCGEGSVSAFADMGGLADGIYRAAGFDMSGVYREDIDDDSAFSFGISEEEFDRRVENAVCLREIVDSKGRALYVFEAESENDAAWLAQKLYGSYEFAPCDAAEKMAVACADKYVMLFKSSADEVESTVSGFRTIAGGTLRFRKEMDNRG